MDFLTLCKRVVAESGTIDGDRPTTVAGQTERLGLVVKWTAEAWRRIQNARSAWRWLEQEYTGSTAIGVRTYSASDTRFAQWITSGGYDDDNWTCYAAALDVADEQPLRFMPWPDFRRTLLRGAPSSGRPVWFSIDQSDQLVLAPVPDAVYVLRGRYRRGPQTLAIDNDEPEMPARFHMAIVYQALVLLAGYDEAFGQRLLWQEHLRAIVSEMERDQLPWITDGSEAIA